MKRDKRKILDENEKAQLLKTSATCYICEKSLKGYSKDEIEYDHIYNFADGYPQTISNFAPVHASKDSRRLNCHKEKGQNKGDRG